MMLYGGHTDFALLNEFVSENFGPIDMTCPTIGSSSSFLSMCNGTADKGTSAYLAALEAEVVGLPHTGRVAWICFDKTTCTTFSRQVHPRFLQSWKLSDVGGFQDKLWIMQKRPWGSRTAHFSRMEMVLIEDEGLPRLCGWKIEQLMPAGRSRILQPCQITWSLWGSFEMFWDTTIFQVYPQPASAHLFSSGRLRAHWATLLQCGNAQYSWYRWDRLLSS